MARRNANGWRQTIVEVGDSVKQLLQVELEALGHDLSSAGRKAGVGGLLLVGAGAFGFWTLGVLTYALVQIVDLWLPMWAAALIVTTFFALIAVVLGLLGISRLRKIENPVVTLRSRVDDHATWWRQRVLGPQDRQDGPWLEDLDQQDEEDDEL